LADIKSNRHQSRNTFYNWLNDPKFNEIYEQELKPNRRDERLAQSIRLASVKTGLRFVRYAKAAANIKAINATDAKVAAGCISF
jgi:hypothetical protein